jgi:hypothetical protein
MNMTRENERSYFERFRKCYKLPEGAVEYGDKPDVLVVGQSIIGVEITRFYREPGDVQTSEQRQQPLRNAIVTDAQKLFRDGGGKNIEIRVNFDTAHPISPPRRKILPTELANVIRENDSRDTGELETSLFRTTMPELARIYFNAKEYDDATWRINSSYPMRSMSTTALEFIVRQKESKSVGYRPCDTLWLLVVVDWIDRAQEQEIRIDDLKIVSTVFERVIVYKPGFEHIADVWP